MIDLQKATMQELADYTIKKLIRQGRPSYNETGCLYRSPNGTKCAIGWLIPDDEYDPSYEGSSSDTLVDSGDFEWKIALLSNRNIDMEFLSDLQATHDNACNSSADTNEIISSWLTLFKEKAIKLYKTYGLELPEELSDA